ncbi:MAG: TolC family protein [Acidobacteriota bacterium]
MSHDRDVNREPWAAGPRRGTGARAALVLAVALVPCGPATGGEALKLTADAVAERAVAVSNVARAATARAEAARGSLAAAEAARLPSVTVAAALTRRSSVPEYAAPINGPLQPPVVLYPNIETTHAAGVRASEVLYSGGAVTAARDAARHELGASTAEQARSDADLRLTARATYWEAVRARASLDAAAADEARAARLLADTRSLLEAGRAVRADVLAAEARVANARVRSIQAATRAADALAGLRSLVALADTDAVEFADTLAGPLPDGPDGLASLRAEALARRPELAALGARLAAVEARETLARAATRPTLALGAQWDLARPNQRYFPQSDSWDDSWAVGVSASWTLFDGGRARADAATSQATGRALQAERAELERLVSLDVETAWRALRDALATVEAADAARTAADERERAAKERHDAGLAAMSEILDAEAELAAAEQQQVGARASAWIAEARLARAVGM